MKHAVFMGFVANIPKRIIDRDQPEGYRLGEISPHTLLLFHKDTLYDFPGGEVKEGESHDVSLWRNIREGIGLEEGDTFEIMKEYPYYHVRSDEIKDDLTIHFYRCDVDEPTLRALHANACTGKNFLIDYFGAIVWEVSEAKADALDMLGLLAPNVDNELASLYSEVTT